MEEVSSMRILGTRLYDLICHERYTNVLSPPNRAVDLSLRYEFDELTNLSIHLYVLYIVCMYCICVCVFVENLCIAQSLFLIERLRCFVCPT